MRINVYSQELTSEVVHVIKESDAGVTHHAAQLMLHSSPMLHHPPMDDDRSAVTFWLPKSAHRREEMARAFEAIARIFRESPLGADQTDPQRLIGTSLTRAGDAAQAANAERVRSALSPTKPILDPTTCRKIAAQITSQDAGWLDEHELVAQLLAAADLAEKLQRADPKVEQLIR